MFHFEFIVRITTIIQEAYFLALFLADEITVTAEQLEKKTNLELRIVFWCNGSPQTLPHSLLQRCSALSLQTPGGPDRSRPDPLITGFTS